MAKETMRTNLERPMTYFIIGPPRSGTTILCNLFNALEDGWCLGEPHWYCVANDARLESKELIRTDEIDNFLDALFLFHSDYFNLYGYKETYRLRHHLCEDLLARDIDRVDFFIIVLRDPVYVHSSQRALGWREWDSPDDHNATYRRLDELAQHDKAIVVVYEDFVKDPLGYLNARLPFRIDGPLELAPTGHAFGDPFANRASEIVKSRREICLTDAEIARHEEGRAIWTKYLMR